MFEETVNGTIDELISYYELKPPKGEIVMVISGYEKE
jgi:16S rRNA C1402 (ribose-2'-O) methylase RsmI